ncbi:hypothetical protein BWR59_06155 [Pseudomonas sp. Bc-h]|nr:hypothetical protein BWR59_06155 [Pseudomonas sp. Bc-h]
MSSPAKPVRKTNRSSRGVRGLVPSMGHYESALERDMMELIRFDRRVGSFTAQPLTISYSSIDGKACSYTPDGLITFVDQSIGGAPILYEIKYREDFRGNWRVLMPKFRAAKKYCAEVGWRFHVYTENEVRTPYLANTKFLWPFIGRSVDLAICSILLDSVLRLGMATPEILLREALALKYDTGRVIPVLWHLIAVGRIGCDLQEKLTLSSRVWSAEEIHLE